MALYKWMAVVLIDLANGIASFDTGVMNLILPTISITLQAPVELVFWVPLVGLIIRAAFMPTLGRRADIHGRKKHLVIGLLIFAVGSLLASVSSTIYELIIYRVIQGVGAASILSVGRALIVDVVEQKERGFALGTNVSVIYASTTLGTAISGSIFTLTGYVGWQLIFLITGVAGLVIALPVLLLLRESKVLSQDRSMDWLGSFLLAFSIGAALVAITGGVLTNFGTIHAYIQYIRIPIIGFYVYTSLSISIPVYLLAVLAVVGFLLFLWRELTFSRPLIDLHLFTRNVGFAVTNFTALLVYVGTFSLLILLSFYLEVIRGLTPLVSGLILAVQPLAVTFFAILGGRLSSRIDKRDLEFGGLVLMLVSLFYLGVTSIQTEIPILAILLVGLGAGFGIFSPNNTNLSLSSVEEGKRSLANGILGMMRHSGQSISLGLATLTINLELLGSSGAGTFDPQQYIKTLNLNFILAALLVMVAAVVYLRYWRRLETFVVAA
jgi:MFS family permease